MSSSGASSDRILSVIVPSYNMERYLPKCLDSLVVGDMSLLRLVDVIVVNDGSKDKTLEVAQEWHLRFPDVIQVIDKPNGNYGSCINAGLAEARGRYIKVLDADDTFDTENFAEYLDFLKDVDDADVVFTDYITVDERGHEHTLYKCPFVGRKRFGIKEVAAVARQVSMHAVTYRTENLRRIGYKQTEGISYTDTEWCFEPMTTVDVGVCFPKVVYRYLIGREGQTVSSSVTRRSYDMYVRLLASMAVTYNRCWVYSSPDAQAYLDEWLKRLIGMIYNICLTLVPFGEFYRAFVRVDSLVKESLPNLYRDFDEEYLSNLFRWRYIKHFRNSANGGVCYLALLRMYLLGVRVIQMLKRHWTRI